MESFKLPFYNVFFFCQGLVAGFVLSQNSHALIVTRTLTLVHGLKNVVPATPT